MAAYVYWGAPDLLPALPGGAALRPEGRLWDLCALGEGAGPERLRCRTLLLPRGLYCPGWQAGQAVEYGLDRRCSLTLSSMGERDVLCVQRTVTDVAGRELEPGEWPLPRRWRRFTPQQRLLAAGVWLLLGPSRPDGREILVESDGNHGNSSAGIPNFWPDCT